MGSFHRWLYSIPLIVFASFSFAAPVTYETVRVGPSSYAPSGVKTPITVKINTAGVSKFHEIVPVASKSTIRKFALFAARRTPQGIAALAVIEALGYAFDDSTGEVIPGTEGHPGLDCSLGCYSATGENGYIYAPTKEGAAAAALKTRPNLAEFDRCESTGTHTARCYGISTSGTTLSNASALITNQTYTCPSGQIVIGSSCVSDLAPEWSTEVVPVDFDHLDNEIYKKLSSSDKTELTRFVVSSASPSGRFDTGSYPVSVTGTTSSQVDLYDRWPELSQAIASVVNASIADYLASLDDSVTVDPGDQEIVDTGSEFGPMDKDLPPFCTWAAWLCEPFLPTEQPELPTVDLEVPDYDSGLPSSASCPAPYQVVTGFGSWSITFDFACQLASAIRTPLLAISYLMSAFIVVGVRK